MRRLHTLTLTTSFSYFSGFLCSSGVTIASVLILAVFSLSPPGVIAQENGMAQRPALPNIVLIVADDFGYGDLGVYGARKVRTPNVDWLAAGGMRFTDAYVASSLCSPSRYSILTGRYSWRTPLRTGVLKPFSPPLIEAGRTTLASLLQRHGYHTACVGKWHLGFDWPLKTGAPADAQMSVFDAWGTAAQEHIDFSKPVAGGPVDRGFDYFFGIAGSNNMIPFVFIENDKVVSPPSVTTDFGLKTHRAPEWDLSTLDQVLSARAVDLIDRHFSSRTGTPLFLYFPTSAVHLPCLPSATKGTSQAGLRGDMVHEFDRIVGAVVNALERNGVLEETLVIVTSDNGPVPGDPFGQIQNFRRKAFGRQYDFYQPYFDNYAPRYAGISGQAKGWLTYDHDPTAGLLGFKSDAWEGGLRVPLIVHWPGHVRAGRVNTQPVCASDLLATFAEITRTTLRENEGEDSYGFLQSLLNEDAVSTRTSLTLVAGRSGALAIRKGDWKYIEAAPSADRSSPDAYPPAPNEFPGRARVDEVQLYNLKTDPQEKHNLAETHVDKLKELQSLMRQVEKLTQTEENRHGKITERN